MIYLEIFARLLPAEGPSEVQLTSTNTSEASSEGGPLRHASTLSRIPFIISLKGRIAASRTNFRKPVKPTITTCELKTSEIPSEERTIRSHGRRLTSRVAS